MPDSLFGLPIVYTDAKPFKSAPIVFGDFNAYIVPLGTVSTEQLLEIGMKATGNHMSLAEFSAFLLDADDAWKSQDAGRLAEISDEIQRVGYRIVINDDGPYVKLIPTFITSIPADEESNS